MKYAIISFVVLMACGGTLSDEQRRQMLEKMEDNKILRITEAEITEAAFTQGRKLVKTLDSLKADSARLRLFLQGQGGKVKFLTPQTSNARLLEKQLIDAYLADTAGVFQDNVQKLRTTGGDFDSLLYTKPVVTRLPDGTDQLEGVWNIWLPKRDLVMEIGKQK